MQVGYRLAMSASPELPGSYRQLCVIAAALDAIGSRWTLLIIRDLARTPLRFTDLEAINPGISPTMLTNRLRQLEADGLIEKRTAPGLGRQRVYRLTDWARPAILRLLEATADLGATILEHTPPVEGEEFDPISALETQMTMNGHFVMARSPQLEGYYVLDVSGWKNHVVIDAEVGFSSTAEPPADRAPDATAFFFPPTVLMRLMGRTMTIADAEAQGLMTIDGDRAAMLELIDLLSFDTPDA